MNKYTVILVTVPDLETGRTIAQRLLENRLCACVTLSAPCRSLYWWEEKITEEKEHILFIKTKTDIYPDLAKKIRDLHPYDVPEIIALPLLRGDPDYLKWIDDVTQH
jgi:periplasmic divalent cation tolerance protein